jgi:hypothetical protein
MILTTLFASSYHAAPEYIEIIAGLFAFWVAVFAWLGTK